jgi:hypothetical protein
LFTVPRIQNEFAFSNPRVRFPPGVEGRPKGFESIAIAVESGEGMAGRFDSTRSEILCRGIGGLTYGY